MTRILPLLVLAACLTSLSLAAEEEKPPTATHGGVPRLVGDDIVELVQDSTAGALTIYLTGEDQKPYAIAPQPLTAQVKVSGEVALISVQLQPKPQPGDPAGKTSAFAGSDPGLVGKTGSTIILRIELDEKLQRVVFAGGKLTK